MTEGSESVSSRRGYLKTGVACFFSGTLAGCGGNSSGSQQNDEQESGGSSQYSVTSSDVTDYIDWSHYFEYDDSVYDSEGIIYNISAENITQNGILAGSILEVSYITEQDTEDSLDVVVNSESFEPGYTWTDGHAFVIPSIGSVTGYSIELFVVRPNRDGRAAEETFEYTGEEFRNRFRPAE